jgi:hypothetical protein
MNGLRKLADLLLNASDALISLRIDAFPFCEMNVYEHKRLFSYDNKKIRLTTNKFYYLM